MEVNKIQINYNKYAWDELTAQDQLLVMKSKEAQGSAYAPYSNFKVGAAILLEDETIFLGNNQENAAYPSGLCAERVAIFACAAQHPNLKIKGIAISAGSDKMDGNSILTPCGSCRQSMYEYELKQKEPIRILLKSSDNQVIEFFSIQDLLPLPFKCFGLKSMG